MKRTVLLALVAAALLVGCGRQVPNPPQVAVPPDDESNGPHRPVVSVLPVAQGPAAPLPARTVDEMLAGAATPTRQDRYNDSLMEALELLAHKKQTEALAALEAARDAAQAAQDTEPIQNEIDRLKESMARQEAADSATQNIRAILDDGRPEEAAKLAGEALAQYGGSDAADGLLKLKREADALAAARGDGAVRLKKARDEAAAAVEAKNLRAAAVALEQALQQGDDAELKKQLDDLHDRLARYDDNRRRAEELRRDPSTLEEALAALQDAQKAWDTFEVQQQIAEYTLAMQNRRERLGVADFEVRGDVGLADAGRTLAEELLPAFKARFDLVERGQLDKVVGELKLEAADLNGTGNQTEIGRLAKVRYLVVGSVTRLGGVTVNARLVDLRSGLVVQTGRVVAPTAEDLLPLLPRLATVLTMTDEQKMAYEQQLTAQAVAAPSAAPVELGALPPPPDVQPDDQPPPAPLATATPVAPPVGEIRPEDFQNLPPLPPPDQPLALVAEERPDEPVKLRLRHVCIELGDNLFRRGRFQDAHVQFELALNAGCDRRAVEIRIDRCRPFLPPPPPPELVVVAPPPRPRVAVLDLAVIGDPAVVPPVLGPWTADNLAPYFCQNYDIVDRDTVCWYMNRLGLSLRDVLTDPVARRWLGRALGVRFFVLGEVRETASFVVTTHLVDAEFGYEYGWGSVHVHDPFELKLRLGDLAGQTLLDPAERKRRHDEAVAAEREQRRFAQMAEAERLSALQDSQNVPLLVFEAQRNGDGGDLTASIELLGRARKLRPDSIEISVLFDRLNEKNRRREWERERRRDAERQQAAFAAAREQQAALARDAEEARQRAAREAAGRQAAAAQLLEQQRQQAFLQLQAQAQLAVQQQQFDQAIQIYQSALALRQTDEVFQALAAARARADEATRLAAAQAAARQEESLRRQREAELARAREQLLEERRNQEARDQAERAARAARDQALYERQLDDGRKLLAKQQYDAAISSLQTARQLRRTDEVERLLSQAAADQARATAPKNNPAAHDDLERRLAEEKGRREKAEAEAAHNREQYELSLKAAQKALAEKNYDLAEAKFQDAGKVYNTDVVLSGLRQVKAARGEAAAAAAAEQTRRDAEAKKNAEFAAASEAGFAALDKKQYDRAVKALNDANRIKPGDVKVLTALSKAEHEQAEKAKADARAAVDQAAAHKAAEERAAKAQDDLARVSKETADKLKKQQADYALAMDAGKAAARKGNYEGAVNAYTEALRIVPADKDASAALKDAQQARATGDAEAKRKADFSKVLAQGQAAMTAKQYGDAARAFGDALRMDPSDATASKGLRDANAALAAATADADKKKRDAEYAADMKAGRAALSTKKYDDALKAFTDAGKLAPGDKDAAAGAKAAQDSVAAATEAQAAKADAEKKKRADYTAAMSAGRDALKAKKYGDAVSAFTSAAKLQPEDKDAAAALKDAQNAAAAADAAKKAEEAKRQADFASQMTQGQTAAAAKKYDAAAKAYQAALQLQPGDAKATAGLQNAQFSQHMAAGQALSAAKKFTDAAKEYQAALTILPDNADAKAALKHAQNNMP